MLKINPTEDPGKKSRVNEEVTEKNICCICGKEFTGMGNNPAPLNKEPGARCCNNCNMKVIEARIKNLKNENIEESTQTAARPKWTYSAEKHIAEAAAYYRELAGFTEDDVLTEDMLRRPFIESTCCRKSVSIEELKDALLKKKDY